MVFFLLAELLYTRSLGSSPARPSLSLILPAYTRRSLLDWSSTNPAGSTPDWSPLSTALLAEDEAIARTRVKPTCQKLIRLEKTNGSI